MSNIYGPSGSLVFYSSLVSYSFETTEGLDATEHFRTPEHESVRFETDYERGHPKGIQFLLRSESIGTAESITALYITTSQKDLKVGLGTDDPLASVDVRSVTSSTPANIILRTNEDGIVTPDEETGRIIFAIESSSYLGTKFISSGSSAEIFSRVIDTGSGGGNYGSLIFSLNDDNGITTPTEVFQLGFGIHNTTRFGLILSSSDIIQNDLSPAFVQKYAPNDSDIARLGYHNTLNLDKGSLSLYDNGDKIVFMSALDGTISSSGAITGSDISITGFTSVSASLAAAGGGGGSTPTLQQVTNQGASTTTSVTASIISASGEVFGLTGSFTIIQGGSF